MPTNPRMRKPNSLLFPPLSQHSSTFQAPSLRSAATTILVLLLQYNSSSPPTPTSYAVANTAFSKKGTVAIPSKLVATTSIRANAAFPPASLACYIPDDKVVGTTTATAKPVANSAGLKGSFTRRNPRQGVSSRTAERPYKKPGQARNARKISSDLRVRPEITNIAQSRSVGRMLVPAVCGQNRAVSMLDR